MKPHGRICRCALVVACALGVLGGFAPGASARQLDRQSETALLPSVFPFGEMRKGERMVSLSARTAADAPIEVTLESICFDRQRRLHRTKRSFTGTGQIRGRVRRPRGRFRVCTASGSVRVRSRPLTPTGELPPPIRLGAALYAGP
jgi:hypothetical protein